MCDSRKRLNYFWYKLRHKNYKKFQNKSLIICCSTYIASHSANVNIRIVCLFGLCITFSKYTSLLKNYGEDHQHPFLTCMLFVRQVNDDHQIILLVGGWLVRPICARKVLVQLGQGMVAGDEQLSAFDFLACRLFSTVMVLSFSWATAPLCRAAHHSLRFCAVSSQVSGFRLKDLRDPFKVSL